MFGSDISARVEAIVTIAPCALRSGLSAARASKKRGRQIGVDDAAPFAEREPAQRLADHDPGIGDDAVEPAETVDELHRPCRKRFLRRARRPPRQRRCGGAARRPGDRPLPGRSMMPTCQPARRRWRTTARPMPFAPPVTRATGFAFGICFLFVALDRQIGATAPFRPGAVVKALRLLADRIPARRSGSPR